MKNHLNRSLLISTLILSGCSATETGQGLQTKPIQTEPETTEHVTKETEIQELKSRILDLEEKLSSVGEPATPNEGWKRVKNWRRLEVGMDYDSVEKILGPAHRIDGGIVANWYYKNGGRVNFYEGRIHRWEEPN